MYFVLGEAYVFVVSRRIASRVHEICNLEKALALSFKAKYTIIGDPKKRTADLMYP